MLSTYFPALVSLLRASLEMTWPQMSFIGGLLSEVCCLRIGQANTEWYQHFFPRSISICSYRHSVNTVTAGEKGLKVLMKSERNLRATHLCASRLHCTVSALSPALYSSAPATPYSLKQNCRQTKTMVRHYIFTLLLLFCSTVSNNMVPKIKW